MIRLIAWADYGITDAKWNEEDECLTEIFLLQDPSQGNDRTPFIIHNSRQFVLQLLQSGKTLVTITGTHRNWKLKDKIVLSPEGNIVVEGSTSLKDDLGDFPVYYDDEE